MREETDDVPDGQVSYSCYTGVHNVSICFCACGRSSSHSGNVTDFLDTLRRRMAGTMPSFCSHVMREQLIGLRVLFNVLAT
jgi:hypothetical protein